MKGPQNELEWALWGSVRGPENYPELFRQLRESMLTFLVPYHPEYVGSIPLEVGSRITFGVWESQGQPQIPLFTSSERAATALRTGFECGGQRYGVAEMKGRWLFAAMAGQELPGILNPACGTPSFKLDVRAARMLAEGNILPQANAQPEHREVRVVDPAEYPMELLGPVFWFLRDCPQVRAAWLFQRTAEADGHDPKRRYYVFGLLVNGDMGRVRDELSMVVRHAGKDQRSFGVIQMDPSQEQSAKIMAKFPAFYRAPDYVTP